MAHLSAFVMEPESAFYTPIMGVPALRQALESSPLARCIGIEFTGFEPGRATALLRGDSRQANFLGYSHTGALFALAEQDSRRRRDALELARRHADALAETESEFALHELGQGDFMRAAEHSQASLDQADLAADRGQPQRNGPDMPELAFG